MKPLLQLRKSQRINILGLPIDVLSPKEIIDRVNFFFGEDRPHQIITANALMSLESEQHQKIIEICNQADLVIPDSIGISWAAKHLSQPKPYRIPGIDLAYQLCSLAEVAEKPVYLLGGKPGVAMKAAEFLYKNFPYIQISGARDGYFKNSDAPQIIKDIEDSRSRLTLVALGMPQQDIWIHEHLSHLPAGIFMGVGGTFDIWSGGLKRAPSLFRRFGMEWLFRLGQEPQRFRRVAHLPKFAIRVLTSR